jgi:nitroreductase
MAMLDLTPDELLSTTRSVRKRLDLTRPVPRNLIEECLLLAQQAPTGSNRQQWHFVIVTDADRRAALGDVYRRGWQLYRSSPTAVTNQRFADPERAAIQARISNSSQYLADNMGKAPVLVVPCIVGRRDGTPTSAQAGFYGSILPAVWSFMLAGRSRGLGTCWTTLHLNFEEEAAAILGIPYQEVTQVALVPVAYTKGTDFKPAPRDPLSTMAHWEAW